MSDSLREALEATLCELSCIAKQLKAREGGSVDKAIKMARAALSAPQADAEADQWRCDSYSAPPSQSAQMRKALEPFASYLDQASFDLDNKGHPLPDDQGMGWVYLTVGDFRRAREALSRADEGKEPTIGGTAFCGHGVMASICDKCADEGKESEGGIMAAARKAQQRVDTWSDAKQDYARRATGSPSDPIPPDQREAIARIIRCTVMGCAETVSGVSGEYDAADAILALLRGGE